MVRGEEVRLQQKIERRGIDGTYGKERVFDVPDSLFGADGKFKIFLGNSWTSMTSTLSA